ncbi:alpha/beta hydrolase [Gordonia humi]|uniref:alpha/beta hydrolase n=1 Tax=Gordonia humi TaxID=686429 RepID=UPI00361E7F25
MLDGLRAPNNTSGWLQNTRVDSWMVGKGTNVAIPFGGAGSFYTNWEKRDPKLGLNKWETFLTKELPAYMKKRHNSDNRRNGIAGLSMSGTAALNLASRHPNFYKAVASFSGYPTVTMPGFGQGIQASVMEMGGNPVNMWGIWPAGEWAANDPFLTAGNLAGHRVYVSSGTGMGSKYDSSITPGQRQLQRHQVRADGSARGRRIGQLADVHRSPRHRSRRQGDHSHHARRRALVGLLAGELQARVDEHLPSGVLLGVSTPVDQQADTAVGVPFPGHRPRFFLSDAPRPHTPCHHPRLR